MVSFVVVDSSWYPSLAKNTPRARPRHIQRRNVIYGKTVSRLAVSYKRDHEAFMLYGRLQVSAPKINVKYILIPLIGS